MSASSVSRLSAPTRRAEARHALGGRSPNLTERVSRRLVMAGLAKLTEGELEIVEAWQPQVTKPGQPGAAGDAPVTPRAVLHVHDPAVWSDVFARGSLGAAESYVAGLWDSPDLTALVRLLVRKREVLDGLESGFTKFLTPLRRLWARGRRNTQTGSRRNIGAHYDLGNDFFELFLDDTLSYSAAIFEHPEQSLEDASVAKIDRLCRKLDLQPVHELLEIGSGWGALAVHAAAHYGCRVTTTTLSEEQHAKTLERVQAAGLEDRVTVLLQDYRELSGQFDRIVSVEMVEAVGADFLPVYMQRCGELLKPDGLFAMQAIHVLDQHYERSLKEVDFIKRYIFPGSFIPSVTALLNAMAERTDMRVVNLEDITPHYARTLREWSERFQNNRPRILATGRDERFLRLWEYYLSYCEGGFEERFIGVSQLVFARPENRRDSLLAARADLAPAPTSGAVLGQ